MKSSWPDSTSGGGNISSGSSPNTVTCVGSNSLGVFSESVGMAV